MWRTHAKIITGMLNEEKWEIKDINDLMLLLKKYMAAVYMDELYIYIYIYIYKFMMVP